MSSQNSYFMGRANIPYFYNSTDRFSLEFNTNGSDILEISIVKNDCNVEKKILVDLKSNITLQMIYDKLLELQLD